MKKWQRIDDGSNITKAGFRRITHKTFIMNNGEEISADVESPDGSKAAGVIAVTREGKIVIARQFRCGPEDILEEIPGGNVDAGEEPIEAAKRELMEEVGYASDDVMFIGKTSVNAWSNTMHYYFLALDCIFTGSNNPEPTEEIEIDEISITDFITNAMQSKMTDPHAVLFAYDKLKELEKKYE
jgi:ADP-ribose pyrophosphatase